MKNLLLLGAAAVVLVVAIASAAPLLIVGTLQAVNNTTFTSATNILSQNFPTPQAITITHGGLVNTNDVLIKQQVSTDLTNWTTFAACGMPSTNATTEVIQGYNSPLTNYYRVLVVTTNSQNVSISYGN
jgi:hypothetical protein